MSMKNSGSLSGMFFAFAAALFFAFAPIIRQSAPAVDSALLFSVQFFGGGLLLFLAALLFQRKELFSFSAARCLRIPLIACFFFVIPSICLYWGRFYTLSVNANFLSFCLPVLLVIPAAVLFGEHLKLRKLIALVLFAIGCFTVTGAVSMSGFHFSFQYPYGDLLITAGALSWTAGILIAKKELATGLSLVTGAWTMLLSGAAFVILLVMRYFLTHQTVAVPDGSNAFLVLGLTALLPAAFGIAAWFAALRRSSLSSAASALFFLPAVSWFISDHPQDVIYLIGLGYLAAGFVFVLDRAEGGGKTSNVSKGSPAPKKEKKEKKK